jgi:D-3-phosphoglycerate dehydrogenase / 2-oxoglutarate reductase
MIPIKRVLLPQPTEKEAVSLLEAANIEVVISPDRKPETVAPLMKGAHAIILRTGIKITRELLHHGKDLWVISRTGAGVDNVDIGAATELGILVTCVPGANTISVIEHTLAMILSLVKYLPTMDRHVRQDQFDIRYKNLPCELSGRTLGVIGLGKIGSGVARICHQSFGMRILGHDPYLPAELQTTFKEWVEFCDLEGLLRESDVVSLHIPFSSDTQKLIRDRELGWMKPDAFIVNTSRGGVIDEAALIQCLKENRIAGAGLDVFAHEPPEKESPLKELDNVILSAHTAGLTRECVQRMALGAAQAILDLHQGRKPGGAVNPEVFTHPRWQKFSLI